jgi:hypothetical protein
MTIIHDEGDEIMKNTKQALPLGLPTTANFTKAGLQVNTHREM